MKTPFIAIQGINLGSVPLVIKYCFCKLADLKKEAHVDRLFTCPHKSHVGPDRVGLASVPVLVLLNPNKKQLGNEFN